MVCVFLSWKPVAPPVRLGTMLCLPFLLAAAIELSAQRKSQTDGDFDCFTLLHSSTVVDAQLKIKIKTGMRQVCYMSVMSETTAVHVVSSRYCSK